ncbi:hypothetical protein GOC38_31725, partial [Sinorhizobium meliloti]|nr:hypothetical protein [Sinorhizobium meliloti]MDX0328392.1 hypothetical protein [Sinorhizobium meliloti]
RGRLFLGIGGRDHFGIRGRIASEFACDRGRARRAPFREAKRPVWNHVRISVAIRSTVPSRSGRAIRVNFVNWIAYRVVGSSKSSGRQDTAPPPRIASEGTQLRWRRVCAFSHREL